MTINEKKAIIEKKLNNKDLSYEQCLSMLENENIKSLFETVINNRKIISQEEIEGFSKNYNLTQLLLLYIEINNITIDEIKLDNSYYSEDIVRQYINDISAIPLLTAQEEVELASVFSKHLKELREDSSIDESKGLRRYLTAKEQLSFDKFISANYRLPISIAKRYVGRGLDFIELIQEGNIGLIRALEKFDVDKGYKFSTYAIWWIRQCITRAIADKGKTIRTSVHSTEVFNKINAISREFYSIHDRAPSLREITCLYLGIDINNVKEEDEIHIMETSNKLSFIMQASQDLVSLNMMIGDSEDTSLSDIIASDEESVEDKVIDIYLKDEFQKILFGEESPLDKREADIIALRFGFYDGRSYTLEEIGKPYGLTRERIRQIEDKALRKLRRYMKAHQYEEFYAQRNNFTKW